MPNSTFQKLKTDKKKLIIDACLREFAHNSFAEASVSRIVKELGIAKGSIYQYFHNKHDLYAYLIETSLSRKYEILDFIAQRVQNSFSLWFLQSCLAEIKFAKEFKNMYHLLIRGDLESDIPITKRDMDFIEKNLRMFQSDLSDAVDIVNIVFLVSTLKTAITAKYVDKNLEEDAVSSEINNLIIQASQIMTIKS